MPENGWTGQPDDVADDLSPASLTQDETAQRGSAGMKKKTGHGAQDPNASCLAARVALSHRSRSPGFPQEACHMSGRCTASHPAFVVQETKTHGPSNRLAHRASEWRRARTLAAEKMQLGPRTRVQLCLALLAPLAGAPRGRSTGTCSQARCWQGSRRDRRSAAIRVEREARRRFLPCLSRDAAHCKRCRQATSEIYSTGGSGAR